ncbi:phage tail protein [Streptococcus suis]|nr:phage tail protein [Streptococcus suis]
MIYLFDKDEKLIKIVRKSAVKTALQKYSLTTERYVSDRLTVELKGLNADELEQVEYMAIQTMEDAHTFHYFYVAQKFSDELTTLIGVQSGIEELRKSPVYDKRPKNTFARDVITDLLAGTNWQARFVGETTPHSTNFYYTSVFDALKKVCVVWDLEMQFFVEMNGNRIGARYIDFKQKIGQAVGKRVVYGHNALQILQEVERTNIFTALIGRGKGEETGDGYGRKITFENVVWSRTQGKPVDKPKGQKYLELPLMTRQYGIKNADGSMRPKIGFVDFSEEENPEILIERTYRALVDSARPQLTLKTSSVYLRGVKVGDTIRVVRHDKKLDYDTRIFEITFNRLNNQSSDIKLGDRIGESNEAKAQTIADKAVEQFVNNEFSNFVQNLPDYLPSADGFNNNWYGTEDPTVKYPGKVLINDIWFKPDPEHEGHKIMLRWTGEVWEEILRTYESEALRDRIAEEVAKVNETMQAQSEEHDMQVANILSKTQSVETLANQAKSDAASAIARANQVKTEAIADARAQVATVSQALNTAKSELQTAIASADQKARGSQASATALRNDLNLQASKILEQARAQTALASRVSTVETLADGTRSTVAELSKTVNKATGNIASVSSRTKTVEDTLSQTRAQYEVLTQTVNAQTGQIDSINRKTADLQSGIDGVTERFENLRVGQKNLILNSDKLPFKQNGANTTVVAEEDYFVLTSTGYTANSWGGVSWDLSINSIKAGEEFSVLLPVYLDSSVTNDAGAALAIKNHSLILSIFTQAIAGQADKWFNLAVTFKATRDLVLDGKSFYLYFTKNGKMRFKKPTLVRGNIIPSGHSLADEDIAQQIAEYKRTADQNYSGLQSTISTLDGKVAQNKTEANQTATQLSNRLTSLETFKNAEGTRAQAYFEAAKTETAKQITAERTATANNYVGKSTYQEDAAGITRRLTATETVANTAKTNLATYQETNDRRVAALETAKHSTDGTLTQLSNKVEQNAQQTRETISAVEAKIPTKVSGRNLATGSSDQWNSFITISSNNNWGAKLATVLYGDSTGIYAGTTINIFVYLSADDIVLDSTINPRFFIQGAVIDKQNKVTWTDWDKHNPFFNKWSTNLVAGNNYRVVKLSSKVTAESYTNINGFELSVRIDGAKSGKFHWRALMITTGDIFPDYWEKPVEDLITEISNAKLDITKTADGLKLAATKTELTNTQNSLQSGINTAKAVADSAQAKANSNASTITQHTTQITALNNELSAKVSKTDYNTLTGRMTSAETTIQAHAGEISKRLTSTQVESAITSKGYQTASQVNATVTSKGYQTKSDVDSNITGRGYITSSALQPYALATTVQNLVKETADSFSRTISETKALIPRDAVNRNLLDTNNATPATILYGTETYPSPSGSSVGPYNSTIKTAILVDVGAKYTFSKITKSGKNNFWRVSYLDSNFAYVGRFAREDNVFTITIPTNVKYLWVSYPDDARCKIEKGDRATPYVLSVNDTATVTALHNVTDTVDSHTRTIGAVGTTGSILDNVSKVTQTANGLVTEVSGSNGLKTQVSTLAGSYAIKNLTNSGTVLNQLNLNKDGSVKIDGKLVQITGKTYIQDGVITSAKIGKGQIGTAHIGEIDAGIARIINLDVSNIKGLDAAFIKAKIENAFIGWMKGKTITAQNEAMTIGLNDAFIRFKDNAKIEFQSENNTLFRTKNGTSAFIHFRDDSYNGVYTAMGVNADNTGTQNDYSSGAFAGVRVIRSNPSRYSGTVVDQVQLVGDEIRIRHGYGYENDYLVIKWDNQGKIDLIKFLRSIASKLGLPLT